jgi:hypothetical protein
MNNNLVDERKQAKDAYMKALEAQKQSNQSNNPVNQTDNSSKTIISSAAAKREKLLEERRRKFFESNLNAVNRNNENTAIAVNNIAGMEIIKNYKIDSRTYIR